MKKNPMYYDVRRAKICKNVYHPSSVGQFFKSLLSVIMKGQSPISGPSYNKRLFY